MLLYLFKAIIIILKLWNMVLKIGGKKGISPQLKEGKMGIMPLSGKKKGLNNWPCGQVKRGERGNSSPSRSPSLDPPLYPSLSFFLTTILASPLLCHALRPEHTERARASSVHCEMLPSAAVKVRDGPQQKTTF